MYLLKEYKSIICILLIAIFVFSFSTIVTSATIDDMDSFKDLEENNVAEENEYENIETKDDEEKNEFENIENKEDEDETKNDIKSNLQQEENNVVENVKKEEQNTSTNSLSKAGIEDTPGILIVALFIIASVYAYIKTNKYNNV